MKEGDYDTCSRIMEPEVLSYIRKFNMYRNREKSSPNGDKTAVIPASTTACVVPGSTTGVIPGSTDDVIPGSTDDVIIDDDTTSEPTFTEAIIA